MRLAIRNAEAIVTCAASGRPYKRGHEMDDVGILNDVDVLIDNGKIAAIGKNIADADCDSLDASGKIVIPGFVDPHTHLIFAGTREHEFALRANGATYEEIAARGGGILETVRATRDMPKSKLRAIADRRIDKFLSNGTTTIEIKSGYGLDFKNELKILEAANELKEDSVAEIVITFLGAHAIPPEFKNDRAGYIRCVTEEMIPYVARRKLAEFCDVFCDNGFFNVSEAERILKSAKDHGLKIKIHADELSANGGVTLATELGAVSADHLENISREEMKSLGKSETVGVVLPAVAAYLRTKPAPTREMIDNNCVVAIATDFNPGTSMIDNMRATMWLAITLNGMTAEEALNAATINAAAALGISDRLGSIEVGKQADMLVIDAHDYSYIPYHFTENRIHRVIKNGTVLEFP